MDDPDHDDADRGGWVRDAWRNPWGRILLISATVAMVSWAVRETAIITRPVVEAISAVALPLAIGFTIAYILSPLVEGLRRIGIPRVVGAMVLFVIFLGGGGLALGFVVPAMIRQSTDLAVRTFRDHHYLDRNRDRRQNRGEPDLVAMAQGEGWYEDRDDNQVRSPGDLEYPTDDDRVQVERSLLRHLIDWTEEKQNRLQRLVARDLEDRPRRFLALYAAETRNVLSLLDKGLQVARDGRAHAQWPDFLRQDHRALPKLDPAWTWDRAWPGVTAIEFDQTAARLSSDLTAEQRDGWREVMRWYGCCFAARNRLLMAAWDATSRPVESAVVTAPVVTSPILADMADATGLPTEVFLERIQSPAAAVLAQTFRQLPAETEDDRTVAKRIYGRLIEAAEQREAYAVMLLERLRGERAEGGSAFLRGMVDRMDRELKGGVERMSDRIGTGLTGFLSNIGRLLSFTLDLVLIPIYAFFLTLAMPGIRSTVKRYLPATHRSRSERILHDIERVVSAFFRGRLIVCAVCAVLIWLGFTTLGVPYAALFGVLIGLATVVPLAGLIFLIPACFLVMVEGGDSVVLRLGLVVGVYALVQTLETTLLTPMIMGREVELHPVMLILALLVFGFVWGILGLILAVPIAATLRILAREFLLPRLRVWAELPLASCRWVRPQEGPDRGTPGRKP